MNTYLLDVIWDSVKKTAIPHSLLFSNNNLVLGVFQQKTSELLNVYLTPRADMEDYKEKTTILLTEFKQLISGYFRGDYSYIQCILHTDKSSEFFDNLRTTLLVDIPFPTSMLLGNTKYLVADFSGNSKTIYSRLFVEEQLNTLENVLDNNFSFNSITDDDIADNKNMSEVINDFNKRVKELEGTYYSIKDDIEIIKPYHYDLVGKMIYKERLRDLGVKE